MQGFSDREPEDWDMAVGTVRGYRWWTMLVPVTSDAQHIAALDSGEYFSGEYLSWSPLAGRCTIQGMHGGQWARMFSENGRYRARCSADRFLYFTSSASPVPTAPHVSETIEAGCGCGFWAYWKELPMEWDACVPYARRDSVDGYHLTIPLAGVIEGSGKTVIGERGFRCEYARVTDLTLSLDGDCVYYDNIYANYGGNSSAFGTPDFAFGGSPRNYGSFASFADGKLHTDFGVMRAVLKAAARKILGYDATWHQDIPDLMRNCAPDENYGNGC